MSFNFHLLDNNLKKLALVRDVVRANNPDVFIIQETECRGAIVVDTLKKMLMGWYFVWSDGRGFSGGLLT